MRFKLIVVFLSVILFPFALLAGFSRGFVWGIISEYKELGQIYKGLFKEVFK